ncbi:MAG: phenylalanine--tRNA ligase subunit beta [Chloroflexota bacterium]|nr:phenylalanine--tRNA ligase subunit beta [Chloroflexota bacterium]
MKASAKWIQDYIGNLPSPREIAHKLTMAGIEVDSVSLRGDGWNDIIVAQVIDLQPHPDADRLTLATVDLGTEKLTVVCGATNLTINDKVPFAHVGAVLMDGHTGEMVKLKPVKIRGIPSRGMICSEKELGISDEHQGIMVLPVDAPIGMPLFDYIGDAVLELSVTPNRPDCLSIIGVAREIAALTEQNITLPRLTYKESRSDIRKMASVEILDPDLCHRYCASLIEGVTIAPSPMWMQERLVSCGMRPINNIVDITNFVMLEFGQPLHAFDFPTLRRGKIIVRRAANGETMFTLDGVERKLTSNMLVIADEEVPIAIAGIMGGGETEVVESTKTVLLESANFNAANIKYTTSSLNLSSEASLRFEKGLSPELAEHALRRATHLMYELAGGKPAKGILDEYPVKIEPIKIEFSAAELKRVLGMEYETDEVERVLASLGFECEIMDSKLFVAAPYWRTDINQSIDLTEEIARITGYDMIPTSPLSCPLPELQRQPFLSFRETARDVMATCGFQEVITYSLVSKKYTNDLPSVRLANPMSSEQEYLRTTLRPSLLSLLASNQRHQQDVIRIAEVGKVYIPQGSDLPQEKEMLVAVMSGVRTERSWLSGKEYLGFYDAKGVVEKLLELLGVRGQFEAYSDDEYFHPGKTAKIIAGREQVGIVGEIHPNVSNRFELQPQPVTFIEIDLDKLSKYAKNRKQYKKLPKFPGSARDIAVIVDSDVPAIKIQDTICTFQLVTGVSLFDVYQGKQVPEGKKSLAFTILYQASDRTLTDAETTNVEQEILKKLSENFGAVLRS